jgi:hypothetical protein
MALTGIYTCPLPTAMSDVSRQNCQEQVGEVVRIFFQRRGFRFDPATNPITALASWTPLLTAADDTKVIVTPDMVMFTMTPGEPATTDENVGGVTTFISLPGSNAEGKFVNISGKIVGELQRALIKEQKLQAYFVLPDNSIYCNEDENGHFGILVDAPFVTDRGIGGRGNRDDVFIRFSAPFGYAAKASTVAVAFDPLAQV